MLANYVTGIPVGIFDWDENENQRIMVYNHLDMTVLVHKTLDGHQRIVGFEVEPFSMANDDNEENNPQKSKTPQYLKPGEEFSFTYRVITRVSF